MDHTMDQSLRYTTLAHQADAMNPQATPAQNHQTATQVRHCPACGAEVPEGEAFCGECGNRM
jgi:membrane protease subunit (stomatin/prohibitin family)